MECVYGSNYFWGQDKILKAVSEERVYNCSEMTILDNQQWSVWREKYSPQEVTKRLWELVETPKSKRDGYVFLYQKSSRKKEVPEILLFVDPICAALALEEYECAEKLLEIGYGLNHSKEQQKYILMNEYSDLSIRVIYLSQFLFISNMPTGLYKSIWEQMPFKNMVGEDLKYMHKHYDLEQDYVCNPLLVKDNSWEDLIDILERIQKIAPEGLEGFFAGLRGSTVSFPIALDATAADTIFRLLQIFQKEKDVKKIVDCISQSFFYSSEKQRWLSVALKVNEKCVQTNYVRVCLINSLFEFLIQCMEDKFWDRTLEKCEKQVIQALKKLCTEEYTQEDFMKYMSTGFTGFYTSGWRWDLFTVWCKELNRELRPHRASVYLQVFFNKAINRVLETFDKSIDELMTLLEALSGINDTGSSQSEIMEETRIVMEDILKIGSEEVLLLCWKKGIITKDTLPMVFQMALEADEKQLLPLLIYLKASVKEKNACP